MVMDVACLEILGEGCDESEEGGAREGGEKAEELFKKEQPPTCYLSFRVYSRTMVL